MSTEPEIIINGVHMTSAQSKTIRIALERFASDILQPGSMGYNDHSEKIAKIHGKTVDSIRPALYKHQPQN